MVPYRVLGVTVGSLQLKNLIMLKSFSQSLSTIMLCQSRKKATCFLKLSNNTFRILRILRQQGLIFGFTKNTVSAKFLVYLRYAGGRPAVSGFKRHSRVGHQVIAPSRAFFQKGNQRLDAIYLVSNPKGFFSWNKPCRGHGVSGSVIGAIW